VSTRGIGALTAQALTIFLSGGRRSMCRGNSFRASRGTHTISGVGGVATSFDGLRSAGTRIIRHAIWRDTSRAVAKRDVVTR
jgi:hypothetical protein